jgi:hypothetical protein
VSNSLSELGILKRKMNCWFIRISKASMPWFLHARTALTH